MNQLICPVLLVIVVLTFLSVEGIISPHRMNDTATQMLYRIESLWNEELLNLYRHKVAILQKFTTSNATYREHLGTITPADTTHNAGHVHHHHEAIPALENILVRRHAWTFGRRSNPTHDDIEEEPEAIQAMAYLSIPFFETGFRTSSMKERLKSRVASARGSTQHEEVVLNYLATITRTGLLRLYDAMTRELHLRVAVILSTSEHVLRLDHHPSSSSSSSGTVDPGLLLITTSRAQVYVLRLETWLNRRPNRRKHVYHRSPIRSTPQRPTLTILQCPSNHLSEAYYQNIFRHHEVPTWVVESVGRYKIFIQPPRVVMNPQRSSSSHARESEKQKTPHDNVFLHLVNEGQLDFSTIASPGSKSRTSPRQEWTTKEGANFLVMLPYIVQSQLYIALGFQSAIQLFQFPSPLSEQQDDGRRTSSRSQSHHQHDAFHFHPRMIHALDLSPRTNGERIRAFVQVSPNILAFAYGSRVEFLHLQTRSLLDTHQYGCRSSSSSIITTLEIDAMSPGIMYATTSNGEVLAFRVLNRIGSTLASNSAFSTAFCQLITRRVLPGTTHPTIQVNATMRHQALATMKGYITVQSQDRQLAMYNVTELRARGMQLVGQSNMTDTEDEQPMESRPTSVLYPSSREMEIPYLVRITACPTTREFQVDIYECLVKYQKREPYDLSWIQGPFMAFGTMMIISWQFIKNSRQQQQLSGGKAGGISTNEFQNLMEGFHTWDRQQGGTGLSR